MRAGLLPSTQHESYSCPSVNPRRFQQEKTRSSGLMRLFHFSEKRDIDIFMPRPVNVPAPRAEGMGWLNGPLVWAIDDWHQPMYLFPRECPRILLWPLVTTTRADLQAYWMTSACRMIAYVEWAWFDRIASALLYRYALPHEPFESLDDAGMWVSRRAVIPTEVEAIGDAPKALHEAGVELRVVPTLAPLKALWSTSLHVSGIRLRNAQGDAFKPA